MSKKVKKMAKSRNRKKKKVSKNNGCYGNLSILKYVAITKTFKVLLYGETDYQEYIFTKEIVDNMKNEITDLIRQKMDINSAVMLMGKFLDNEIWETKDTNSLAPLAYLYFTNSINYKHMLSYGSDYSLIQIFKSRNGYLSRINGLTNMKYLHNNLQHRVIQVVSNPVTMMNIALHKNEYRGASNQVKLITDTIK